MKIDDEKDDAFDLEKLRLSDEQIKTHRITPRKILKRRKTFVQFPALWAERLHGASGLTWELAWHLLFRTWKGNGEPVNLANGMLEFDGISRQGKWRALGELERRGLVLTERRPRKSPIVRIVE